MFTLFQMCFVRRGSVEKGFQVLALHEMCFEGITAVEAGV